MEEFRHRGLIIILAASAMLLLALSLMQPWFTIRDAGVSQHEGYRSDTYDQTITIHLRYFTADYRYFGESTYGILGSDSEVGHLMGNLSSYLLICLGLAWLLTIAAVVNSRLTTLVLGWLAASACLLCVFFFSGSIPGAARASSQSLRGSTYFITGLFGSKTLNSGTTQYVQIDRWSWGPGLGWVLAVASSVLLFVAVALTILSACRDLREYFDTIEFEKDMDLTTNPVVDENGEAPKN
jgi:hypothetical protein